MNTPRSSFRLPDKVKEKLEKLKEKGRYGDNATAIIISLIMGAK